MSREQSKPTQRHVQTGQSSSDEISEGRHGVAGTTIHGFENFGLPVYRCVTRRAGLARVAIARKARCTRFESDRPTPLRHGVKP